MKPNFFLAIGLSIVVLLGALSAFENKHAPKLPPGKQQTEMIAQAIDNS